MTNPVTPSEVNITIAATWLTVLHGDPQMTHAYRGALAMFAEMLSMSDADALNYAHKVAGHAPGVPDVIAAIPPL